MKQIILTLCVVFAFITSATAGEIYTYTDKNGITVISDEPVPEKYQKKAKKIESYKPSSPEEIQRYNAEQEAKEQRHEAESGQRQQINEANRQQQPSQRDQSNIQDIRNREADKLEAAAKQYIPGSRGMTAAQRNELDNAARIRAGESTVPYTPPPSHIGIDQNGHTVYIP